MRILRYLSNIARGQYRHWNDTNNRVISSLWERLKGLDPAQRIVFQEFVVSSMVVVDHLLGPDKGNERLLKVKPKSVNLEQFQKIHALLLGGFVRLYEEINPQLSQDVRQAYRIVVGTTLTSPARSKIDSQAFDLATVANDLWQQLVKITGSGQGSSFVEAYPFTVLLGSVASK